MSGAKATKPTLEEFARWMLGDHAPGGALDYAVKLLAASEGRVAVCVSPRHARTVARRIVRECLERERERDELDTEAPRGTYRPAAHPPTYPQRGEREEWPDHPDDELDIPIRYDRDRD